MAAGTAIGVGELRSGREEKGAEEGEEVGREQRVRERSEGVEGRCVAFTAASGSGGKQEVARARAGVRRTHAWHPSGARWEVTGIGQLGWAGSWAAQVRPGKFSLLSDFYFSFLIFLLFVLT